MAACKGTTAMVLDQYSLASLIARQVSAGGAESKPASVPSVEADYFWAALGDEMRRARILSRMVVMGPESGGAAACERVKQFETV